MHFNGAKVNAIAERPEDLIILIEALRRNRDLSSEALLASIVEEVRHFSPHEQHDDITLIVARCREDQ